MQDEASFDHAEASATVFLRDYGAQPAPVSKGAHEFPGILRRTVFLEPIPEVETTSQFQYLGSQGQLEVAKVELHHASVNLVNSSCELLEWIVEKCASLAAESKPEER
jgi:hypothetical protein